MYALMDEIRESTVDMRTVFCNVLLSLARENKDICLLDADLMGAMGTKPFLKEFPERTFDCGIQEANMFGVAAGLSVTGKIPFAHTFAVFASRRALDQIYLSCAYAGQNVKIIGSDCGIHAALNGGTHMAIDDMGIFRAVPEMTVIEPTDNAMLEALLPQVAAVYGCFYLRLVRRTTPDVYMPGSEFTIGKANILKEGEAATIIANGYCVSQALLAEKRLKAEGISVGVIDCFTLKPLDERAIIQAAQKTGNIITVENHNTKNGLGSAVAEVLCEHSPARLSRLGFIDRFGEVGKRDELAGAMGINADAIYSAVKKSLE
ncbi:MAG TPA: transketolase [Clostridiales bacterium]|nr:transketolase [Clostridiales bacterium]